MLSYYEIWIYINIYMFYIYINETSLSPVRPVGRCGVGQGVVGWGLMNGKTQALHFIMRKKAFQFWHQTGSNISCKKGKNTLVLSKYEEGWCWSQQQEQRPNVLRLVGENKVTDTRSLFFWLVEEEASVLQSPLVEGQVEVHGSYLVLPDCTVSSGSASQQWNTVCHLLANLASDLRRAHRKDHQDRKESVDPDRVPSAPIAVAQGLLQLLLKWKLEKAFRTFYVPLGFLLKEVCLSHVM